MSRPIRKVLMLAHPEMDHLAYMSFNGLYKVLGKDNIAVYPFVRHYQGGIDDWYTLDDGKRGYTAPIGYIGKHETVERSFNDLAKNINSFDIIYLSSARTYAVNALNQFIDKCGRKNLPPIVFSEGEDYQDLHAIRTIKHKYKTLACFKREYIQSELDKNPDLHPLYPLPFSAIIDNMPPDNPNKDIDIFALFGNTYPLRENVVRKIMSSHLPRKYKIHVGIDRWNGSGLSTPPLAPYNSYLDLMSRAKINIIARGWGCDTLRRFEALCFSGLVMSDNIPITTPYPFIDNQTITYYDNNLNGLIERIEYILIADNERRRIGTAGREHCMKYHTTEERAKYFLNRIEGHL